MPNRWEGNNSIMDSYYMFKKQSWFSINKLWYEESSYDQHLIALVTLWENIKNIVPAVVFLWHRQ